MSPGHVVRVAALGALCALAACGGARRSSLAYEPERGRYPAPGPEGDPWGPYVQEASTRFRVPAQWIRAVMHQESGGHQYLNGEPITSASGAMGLMQLMPATYGDLQAQYGLGDDPYDPHDNILAGTAYIRQMYDKYGSPGFLAAYNAGPARVDDYLAGEGGLPNETVNYVASIAPNLGPDAGSLRVSPAPAPSPPEPVVQYAAATPMPEARAAGADCWHDPDAAYDPQAPCEARPASPPVVVADVGPPPAIQPAAYRPAPSAIGSFAALPPPSGMRDAATPRFAPATFAPVRRVAYAVPVRPRGAYDAASGDSGGAWAIQVGAFGRPEEARFATTMARDAAYTTLAPAREVVMQIPGLGGHPLYRARLAGLDRGAASAACARLHDHALSCILVPPGA